MSRGRGRRHNQLPGDDLVAIAVVGERADHGGSPPFSGLWHTHIVLGSARVAQVDTVQNAPPSIRNAYRIIATERAFTRVWPACRSARRQRGPPTNPSGVLLRRPLSISWTLIRRPDVGTLPKLTRPRGGTRVPHKSVEDVRRPG